MEYAVIILAAGPSLRLGRPKQYLLFKEETLLKRIVSTATTLNAGPAIIVLGANAELFNETGENIFVVINEEWKEGMSSSIRLGIKKLMKDFPSVEGAIITVCDQPFVSASLLQELISMHQQTLLPIIASSYDNTVGTPVFFHRSVFAELLQLSGDRGAKQILFKQNERVGLVNFPRGSVDVDTEEDYLNLI